MIKKCLNCQKEFDAKRKTAKFHNDACKLIYNRKTEKVEPKGMLGKIVEEEKKVVEHKKMVEDLTNGTDSERARTHREQEKEPQASTDPLKRITRAPEQITADYYKSETYRNLIEELELKPVEQLKKEGYFIPNWKLIGLKKMPTPNQIKGLAGGMTVDQLNSMS